jgi:NAD+ synthase (glutamine-hydrolysing)
MKVVLSQLNYHVGNFDFNTSKILDAIKSAKAASADLISCVWVSTIRFS